MEEAEARRNRMRVAIGVVAGVLVLAALVYWLVAPGGSSQTADGTIQTLPLQGATHIQRGQTHPEYNSTPPTSGWHYSDALAPAPWGVSAQPVLNEVQVHNLEHGGIMVQYDCPSGCADMVRRLEAIVRSYPSKVILAPYPGIGHPIALTAWGRLAYLDTVDETFIRRFIDQFKNKGPEVLPD